MKISIGNQMISAEGSASERFGLARDAGLDGVEFWLGSGDITMATSDEAAAALAADLRVAGLECSSIASTLGWATPITSPDDSEFASALAVGRRQIELATVFGADAILVVTGRVLPEVPWRQAWERMVAGFRELCDYALPRGVRIGAETCPALSKNLMTPGECTAFVEAVDRPNIGVYLDVANALYSGYPQDFIRELGGRLVRIHAKDRCAPDASGKSPSTWPGNGIADWRAVREACLATGYDAWAVLEFSPPAGEPLCIEHARKACAATRNAFGC